MYPHSLSQPITVPRSRQLSPPSSSFSPPSLFPPPYLPSVGGLAGGGGVRGESQPWVLLPQGVITPLWDSLTHTHAQSNTQLVSSVSFYLSPRHYTLQVSPWPSLWGFDAHTHTHTSNPNVPAMFVITLSPDGTRPIGLFFFGIRDRSRMYRTDTPSSEFCVLSLGRIHRQLEFFFFICTRGESLLKRLPHRR